MLGYGQNTFKLWWIFSFKTEHEFIELINKRFKWFHNSKKNFQKIVFKYKTTKFTLSIDTAKMNTKTGIFKWNKKLIVLSSYQIKRHLAVSNDEVWQSYFPWPVSLWVFHPGREQPAGLRHTWGYAVTAGSTSHQWTQQARKLTKSKSKYWEYRE